MIINRRNFLKSVSTVTMAAALADGRDISDSGICERNDMTKEWITANKNEAVRRLSPDTHELSQQALSGQWGRQIKNADFALPASAASLSMNMQYAQATMAAAQNAPVCINPDCLLVGSATLDEGRRHLTPLLTSVKSVSHTTIGFDKVLKYGYKGIREKINERLSRGGLDAGGVDLLNSMLVCLDAADIWHVRYLAGLQEKIAQSSGQEKDTYTAVYEALKNVPQNPPHNFHEAVQSLWFSFAFQKLMGNWSGLGRIDEMLGPYLKNDLDKGVITKDQARELLAHFWILGCEWTTCAESGSGDAQYYQNVILGGIDESGNEITNEVTYLVLDVVEELHISDFPIAVRINRNTPEKLLGRIAEVQRLGGGMVAVYNEEVVIDGLVKFGYNIKDARRFTNDGCWEVLIPGQTAFIYSPMDMLAVMQNALGANLSDELSFDDVYAKFLDGLSEVYNGHIARSQQRWYDKENKLPCPLLSILVDDCIERAKDYNNRGAKYCVFSPHMGGMADVANSFIVLKELVYEQKTLTLSEFCSIVNNDWQGQESLRRLVLDRIEAYGNDNEQSDSMMVKVFNDYTGIVGSQKSADGVLMPAGISTFGREIEWLKNRKATFSGHKVGDVLATNFSPTPDSDKKGPTAAIKSYCKMDFTRCPGGATLEIKLHPASVTGDNGKDAMVSLIKTFQKLGGWYMQTDVVDSALLIDAQKHPEKYQNLPVRVAGWSARFATLNKQWQDMIINRTQQRV